MASTMGLHLQYRLWIAEMNADINVLRIFDDYLAEITSKNKSGDVLKRIKEYQAQFLNLRNNIDDLRHEMHMNKMNLAAMAKKPQSSLKSIRKTIKYRELKSRYRLFRKTFDKTKREFQRFENRLMK
jgi:hypothetical protein